MARLGPGCCNYGLSAIDWVKARRKHEAHVFGKPRAPKNTGWALALWDGSLGGCYVNIRRCPWCGALLTNFVP